MTRSAARSGRTETYRHPESDLALRPEVGTQPQFRKRKPPVTYRYDTSLSPSLEWDGENGVRERGEWLLALIDETSRLPPPHEFAGLGFAIPYFHNGQPHDYEPDFIIRLADGRDRFLILETKGYNPIAEVKRQAANRWIDAVNAEGRHGSWQFAMARRVGEVRDLIDAVVKS